MVAVVSVEVVKFISYNTKLFLILCRKIAAV
jgi:hypothetical protein